MWTMISAASDTFCVSGSQQFIHINQSTNGLTVLLELSGISVNRVQQNLYSIQKDSA